MEPNGNQGAGATLPPIPTRAELERAGIRIALGIPLERNLTDLAFLHLWEVARAGWPLIGHRQYGRTDVHRNEFARALLKSDYTHLAMLDTDQLHPYNVIEHLARWLLHEPGVQIVSGFHFRRGEPYEPLAFVVQPDQTWVAPVEWGPGLYPFDIVGHGSIIISREVFETLPEPWWAYTYGNIQKTFPSEDVYFCQLVRNAGFNIWVDTTQTSPHLIPATVDADAYQGYLADHPEKIIKNEPVPEPATEPALEPVGA